MVKLTPELIEQAAQYTNPIRDRELDLRGYKVPVIENMGATLDQFDTVDLSDNDIRKLDGFPILKRIKCLLLNNNRIVRIAEDLHQSLPNLESLIMSNNGIQELADLDHLVPLKGLTTLSLMRNPVTQKRHYRLYIIYKIPQLLLLDFQKIKQKEREMAAALFKSKKGKEIVREGKKNRTFTPGAPVAGGAPAKPTGGPNAQDMEAIKRAIANARTLEEVERLTQILKSGSIPGRNVANRGGGDVEEEEMDTGVSNGS